VKKEANSQSWFISKYHVTSQTFARGETHAIIYCIVNNVIDSIAGAATKYEKNNPGYGPTAAGGAGAQ
jgi:hypothetical protein